MRYLRHRLTDDYYRSIGDIFYHLYTNPNTPYSWSSLGIIGRRGTSFFWVFARSRYVDPLWDTP